MPYTLVHEELGTGAAGSIIGTWWTIEPGNSPWAKNGAGLIVPGESWSSAIRRAVEAPTPDIKLAGKINAATHSELNHEFRIRGSGSDWGVADTFVLFSGPEVYYNGAYQNALSYGNYGTFSAHPLIEIEAEGSSYRIYRNGVLWTTFTAARSGGTGSNYAGFKANSSSEWQYLAYYNWQEAVSSVKLKTGGSFVDASRQLKVSGSFVPA